MNFYPVLLCYQDKFPELSIVVGTKDLPWLDKPFKRKSKETKFRGKKLLPYKLGSVESLC